MVTIPQEHSRRKFVQGLGAVAGVTSLAGCSSLLENDNGSNEESGSSQADQETSNPPNGSQDKGEEETGSEETDDKEPSQQEYTWQDILDAEQQFYEDEGEPLLRETARSLSNGQVPDTEYSPEDFEFSSVIGYTDNSGEFSIERFKEESYEDALQDLSTLMFLKTVERLNGDPAVSGLTRSIGWSSERIFKELRDQEVRYSAVNNDGHGFWPLVLSPGEDPYTIDVNTNFQGKTWEDPMSQRSGTSPITNFDESMIPKETLNSREKVSEYQTMLKRLSDQPTKTSYHTGVNPELIPEINEEVSSPGSMYHTLVPAIAVLNYQHQRNPDQGYILNPDSITDLPEFRPSEDEFQEYRKQVEENIETIQDKDRLDDIVEGLESI